MPQAKSKSKKQGQDAIVLLKADHKEVKTKFEAFKKLKKNKGSDAAKSKLVAQICLELTVHTRIEEEIFYPAVRAAIKVNDLMDEADVEHEEAKGLIAQLKNMQPADDHYDAKVTVLGENIDHHVEEEHEEMFPKARKSKVDLIALGAQLAKRKKELLAAA